MQKFFINNIPIHSTTIEEIKSIFNNSFTSKNTPFLITTFNLDFLRITTIDKTFNNICKNSKYNLPDGIGITYLIKKKYNKKIKRITGNDIFPILLDIAKDKNLKIAIIGGAESVSQKAEQIITNQYKIQTENLLCIAPKYKFEEDAIINNKVIEKIKKFQPDIVFAALGCPRQEKWLYENMTNFGTKINIGIGATLDFFTKAKKRSPVFLQSLGLEWLWRLLNEPSRLFKRYIIQDLPFFLKIYFSKKI